MAGKLIDGHGRAASYLRVSVTDRCNLLCRYCASKERTFIPHDDILRYEEITEVIEVARRIGIDKVRFTGGEPFVRKGFADYLEQIGARFPDLTLAVTTNATVIGKHIDRLAVSGLSRVNISLDTMDRDRYRHMTGRDLFDVVLENVRRCVDAGMTVKVNAVGVRGFNDDELPAFVEFARQNPVDVRFIEFMPIGTDTGWNESSVWTSKDIVREAGELADLAPAERGADAGPANMFAIRDGKGRIGVISPYTNHFCGTCNRLRLTSEGNLRTCLFSDKVFHLRKIIRHPTLDSGVLERVIRGALRSKPIGNDLLLARSRGGVCSTKMASIGG
ncbi:GTP 3',8-cyclase MoaA [Salidesulfovibrio brasiliensis]|uniref:GTP 3',8-cyclase MoaA n=1 Tax=Salidesulfovibrio brasiliensis TaxID=221711 RepID=UPI0006D24D57|nr:GTP 3',8-cyclase MoaA [Salidesulfovibrio brasiliensis]